MSRSPALGQFARFAAVGLVSNALLYLAYLGLTRLGATPMAAMSLVYAVGVAQTFFANRSWTFQHRADPYGAFGRYVTTYAVGYVVNVLLLLLLVDRMGFAHQWVQALAIIIIAVLVFTLQKTWVFRRTAT